jgi:hypothetical protein
VCGRTLFGLWLRVAGGFGWGYIRNEWRAGAWSYPSGWHDGLMCSWVSLNRGCAAKAQLQAWLCLGNMVRDTSTAIQQAAD